MNVSFIIILGIALAMDAFGVCLGIGISPLVNRKTKVKYCISFSFFQFLLTFVGGVLGYYFDSYIAEIPSALGGIIIAIIGVLMIADGRKSGEDNILINENMVIVLGISVSIDALVIGFSAFQHLGGILILSVDCMLIGLITLFMCFLAFIICKFIRKINFVAKYSNYLGGIALILFAIKMIFF